MKSDIYYLVSACAGTFGVFISALNLYIILWDKRPRIKAVPCFISGSSTQKQIIPVHTDIREEEFAMYRAGILIYNKSSVPCTIFRIMTHEKTSMFKIFMKNYTKNMPIDGFFEVNHFPQVLKGKETTVYTFDISIIKQLKNFSIVIETVEGANCCIDKCRYEYKNIKSY